MDNDDGSEDIGWLKAKIETILENQVAHDKRLADIEQAISFYRWIVRLVKFSAAALVAFASFKFGDLHGLWQLIDKGMK